MNYGFKQSDFPVITRDGRNFTLISPVDYEACDGTIYRIPAGATSDGASTPPEIWPLIPPFGAYWPAAVLHDAAYRNTLLVYKDSAWQVAELPKDKCDLLLKEAMESLAVPAHTVEEIYLGVKLGGWSSFEQDRKTLTTNNK